MGRSILAAFSQFLTCPLTLPPVPASHALFIIFAPRGTGFVVLSHHSLFKTCRESAREVCTIKFTTVLRRGICLNCISARAPIVATWAGRFSRRCWQRFSQFLTCPLTLPPVPASHALFIIFAPRRHCCLATAARGRGRTDTESTRAVLSCSDYCNLTVTEVSC